MGRKRLSLAEILKKDAEETEDVELRVVEEEEGRGEVKEKPTPKAKAAPKAKPAPKAEPKAEPKVAAQAPAAASAEAPPKGKAEPKAKAEPKVEAPAPAEAKAEEPPKVSAPKSQRREMSDEEMEAIRDPKKNRLGKYEDSEVPKSHYKKVSITLPPEMFFDLDDVARTRRRREQPFTISELIREALATWLPKQKR